jgi:hypothetical protein
MEEISLSDTWANNDRTGADVAPSDRDFCRYSGSEHPPRRWESFSTAQFRYSKLIRSVRLSVEALSFKASFAALALC